MNTGVVPSNRNNITSLPQPLPVTSTPTGALNNANDAGVVNEPLNDVAMSQPLERPSIDASQPLPQVVYQSLPTQPAAVQSVNGAPLNTLNLPAPNAGVGAKQPDIVEVQINAPAVQVDEIAVLPRGAIQNNSTPVPIDDALVKQAPAPINNEVNQAANSALNNAPTPIAINKTPYPVPQKVNRVERSPEERN